TRRYETANGLALDIQRYLGSEPVRARPPGGLYRFRKLVRRNRAVFAAGAAIAVALLAGLTGIAIQWRRAEAAGRATRERLAHEHVRAGLRLAEDGDALRGLPHFVEALRLGLGSASRERVTRLRFEMTMRQAPQLAHLWLREEDGEAQFAEEAGRILIIDGVEVRVWDAASGVPVSAPMRHSEALRHAWIDPQASRVVTERRDDHITVWEPGAARVLAEMSGRAHLRGVLGGPRLRLPIWVQKGRIVQCISALDGAVDATFDHPDPVSWAVAAPDGLRVLVAAGNRMFLWDVASHALAVPPVDFGGEPDFGTFDPSGHLAGLRVKHEGDLALFDLTTGAIAARGATKSLGSIRHGWLDGTRWVVLSRKFSGSALRDPVTDRLLFDAQSGAGTVTSDFAARRNVFALIGENGASQVWDADAAQAITPRLWAAGRPSSAMLSADATRLLISSSEPAVRLWKMQAQGGSAWTAVEPAPAVAVWWNADGGQLRTVGADGRLTRRDVATGRLAFESAAFDDASVAAAPDSSGRLVFVGGPHGARLWDAESGRPAGPLIPCPEPIHDIALSGDGRRAAIVTGERTLLCDPATGAVRHTLVHRGTLRSALGADGARLASITRESVQLWNTDTGQKLGEPITASATRHTAGARFDPTGRRLAVWWAEPELPGKVRIVAAETGRDLLPPFEHPSVVTDAAFSPSGDLLITASGDQRLWLWRMRDGLPALAPILHAGAINAVGFSPDGLLFWSRTGRLLHTWETATGDAAVPFLQHIGPPPAEPGRKTSGGVVTHDKEEVRIAWSTDHRVSICDGRGGVNVWDFSVEAHPLEEMESLARVLSMHRIEPGGGLVPLTREELRAAWTAVHR
ncbi:MAG: WD40 repeat domain-containing protein, partial [Chthoniobacteraceae bacterium]